MIKRFRRMLPTLLMTLAALLVAACNTTTETVTGVSIDVQDQALTLPAGQELLLVARASGSGGPINVSWRSSHDNIASVDTAGLVRALTEGSTIITASSSINPNLKDTVMVTVAALNRPDVPVLPSLPVKLQVNTVGNGEVTGYGDEPYDAGATVQLAPLAADGWRFDRWAGDATGSDDPLDLVLDRNMTITAVFTYSACSEGELVIFGDETVEQAVRQLFGISGKHADQLTCSQVQKLIPSQPDPNNDGQELANLLDLNRCGAKPITSLEGLQHLIHLTRLELSCNELDDISQLASLTNLIELNLDNNLISDLTPLTLLLELEVLGLYHNNVESLRGLEALASLRILYLSNNRISDLSPLTGLDSLEHLWLYLNCANIEFDPASMKLLSIQNCLSDISPVAEIASLKSLLLGLNDVIDLGPLRGLNQLQMLHAVGNGISDIDALRELPQLRTALLDSNYLTDLAALADNSGFVTGVSPFVFKRGTVELLLDNNGKTPLPNLTLAENCLNVDDPLTLEYHAALDKNLAVVGFGNSQSEDYWCGSRFAAQSLQPGQARLVTDSMNEALQQFGQGRSR